MCDEKNAEPLSAIAAEYEKLEDQAEELKFAQDAFLRRHGWKYTSRTPGCYWMWERLLTDGRTVLAGTEHAMSITVRGDYTDKL